MSKTKQSAMKQDNEHGLAITKAAAKGVAMARKAFGSDALTESLSSAVSKVINRNITVTSTGLSIADGYSPSEEEVTEAIAGLCGINEEATKFRTTVTWAIGDAANLAAAFDGGFDRVTAQAISERGVSKHTVMQASVVCKAFTKGDRIPGLSFTHHQELFNYRKGIKNKKGYEKLIEELKEAASKDEAMSCSELRQRLRILAGKNAEDDGDKESKKAKKLPTYLYISEEGDVLQSAGLNEGVCAAGMHLVIDLNGMCVLKTDGSNFYDIPMLDGNAPQDEAAEEPTTIDIPQEGAVKEDEAKAMPAKPKPKKKPAKAKKKSKPNKPAKKILADKDEGPAEFLARTKFVAPESGAMGAVEIPD